MLYNIDIMEYNFEQCNNHGYILELDASDPAKFSRHLIVSFPDNLVFRNNIDVGKFVNLFCNHLTSRACLDQNEDSNLSPDALLIRRLFFLKRFRDNDVNLRLFVDQLVYRSTQNFRMVLSTKFTDTGKRHFNVWLPKQRTILEKSKFSETILNDSLVCLPSLLNGVYQQFVPCNFSCLGLSQIPKRVIQLQNVSPSSHKNHALSDGQMFPKLVDYFQKQVAVFWPKQYNADLNIPPMLTAKVYKICYYNSHNPILIIALFPKISIVLMLVVDIGTIIYFFKSTLTTSVIRKDARMILLNAITHQI